MPEVIFTGPAGRLEGRFTSGEARRAHSDRAASAPAIGGTMNNQIIY